MRKARLLRRALAVMALTGSDIWLATALAQPLWFGMVLLRIMDWVKASAMAFRSAVSFVHAARSTRLMAEGTSTAARIAMIASTATVSIKVQPAARGRWGEAADEPGLEDPCLPRRI